MAKVNGRPIDLACPACSVRSPMPTLLERREERKTYYCSCCGMQWGLLCFDVDAHEVFAAYPFLHGPQEEIMEAR